MTPQPPHRSEFAVRPATVDDLPAVREIYNHYVATTTCTFQLEPETLAERERWFHDRDQRHAVTVAESDGVVAAWASLSPWKSRCAYEHSAEVSVYVRHDRRRMGLGRALLRDLIARARSSRMHTLIAGVCTEHPGSIALHESEGFERAALFRQVGRKFDRWLDVAYLQLMLGEPGGAG